MNIIRSLTDASTTPQTCPEGFAWDPDFNRDDGESQEDFRLRRALQRHCGSGSSCAASEFYPWKLFKDGNDPFFLYQIFGRASVKLKWQCEKRYDAACWVFSLVIDYAVHTWS